MNIWVVSTFLLLLVMLLWTLVYKDLFESLLSVLLRIHLGVELLNIITWCLTKVRGTAKLFFESDCSILYSHQQCMWITIFPHPCQHSPVFLNFTILVDVKWYGVVVLVCISPTANDVELLFLCSVVCISSLLIINLGCLLFVVEL